jgi:hypothetical protein
MRTRLERGKAVRPLADETRPTQALPLSWDLLRSLAAFRSSGECAISLFIDLDPSVTPVPSDAETRLHSLHDQVRRELDEGTLGHAQKVAVRADLERIDEWWDAGVDRQGALGVALFVSSLDRLWRELPIVDVVPDSVGYGPRLRIGPLVEPTGDDPEGALVAVVSSGRGRVYRLHAGELEEIVERSDRDQLAYKHGARKRPDFHHHLEMVVHKHLKAIGGALDLAVREDEGRRQAGPELVIVIRDELRGEFEATASDEVLKAIVGWAGAEEHATPAQLLGVVRPVLASARERGRKDRLERWRAERGSGGLATAGWEKTLEASADGRVDVLFLRRGTTHLAFRCPRCERPALLPGSCALDGETLVPDDGAELAVHGTIRHRGTADVVPGGELDDAEGVASLLRF